MKTKMKLLAGLMLVLTLLALTPVAQAQIGVINPSGVVHAKLTTNAAAIMIPGVTVTNFTTNAQVILPVPRDGRFGFYIQSGATNATTTTNCNCIVEGIMYDGSGRANVVDNFTITITVPVNGTTAYDVVTNFPTLATDSRIYSGLDGIRLRSCDNTNTASIWLTNLMQLRP